MRPNRSDTTRLLAAPRCAALSKRSGQRCNGPAVKGRNTCRMHGGTGNGAPRGVRNGAYKHGGRSIEAIALARRITYWGRLLKILPK